MGLGTLFMLSRAGAAEFESFKKGVKLTLPRLTLFLLSQIVWLMADASVAPHQLYVESMLVGVDIRRFCVLLKMLF